MKKFFILCCLLLISTIPVCAKPGTIVSYTIDAEKNAYVHNNKGVEYVSEKMYYAAIQEFKIAISLNPKKQSTAVYFNNLGKVYMTIGYPQLALDCFENSIVQYPMNLDYYINLANCYKELNMSDKKLEEYKSKEENPLNKIMVGVMQAQNGDIKRAIITLDEFTANEPDIIITPAVKNYIDNLTKKLDEE